MVVINLFSYVADMFDDLAFFFGLLGYKEIGFSFPGQNYLKFIWVFRIRCRRLFWLFVIGILVILYILFFQFSIVYLGVFTPYIFFII